MNLSEIELDIAKEHINIGLGKAADSLSFFTKNNVLIKIPELFLFNADSYKKISKYESSNPLHVLKTKVIGELEGRCYLVFSQQEVDQLLSVNLPSSILEDPIKLEEMSEAILLELDNIVVASVITLFSNTFKLNAYGGVPSLQRTSTEGFQEILQSESRTSEHILYFKSEFLTTGLDINPEIIWFMNDKYFESVKSLAQNKSLLNK